MGTITVTVEDNVEHSFRETVSETVGRGKGTLGKAVNEAMQVWIEKKKQQQIAAEMLALLNKGFCMGKFKKISRDELHER